MWAQVQTLSQLLKMDTTKKNYIELDPRDPVVRKRPTLENPASANSLPVMVKYNPRGCVLPQLFSQFYDEVQEFPVQDSDIWVISQPKAGSAWTQEMIWLLTNNYDFQSAKKSLEERFVFFERSGVFNDMGDFFTNQNGRSKGSSFQIARQMTPRMLKTHLPSNLLPAKLRNGERKPRIVYVARHPKDVVVSWYHHLVLFSGYIGSLEDAVEEFTSDLTMWSPYWTHVREFWERRQEPNVFFLKYEDMKEDLSKVIQELAQFLQVPLPDELQLKSLLKHLSFDGMKLNPYVNRDELTDKLITAHGVERKSHYIRKGKAGGWKEELSPAAIQMMDTWIEKNGIEGLYGKDK